jgi:triosephosphate isomerase (TIM)
LNDPDSQELAQHLRQPLHELDEALDGLPDSQRQQLIIAYEPLWAISSQDHAVVATGHYANAVAEALKKRAGLPELSILYGGSVNAANAAEFLAQPAIDGVLVGGASLRVKEFLGICRAAS